MAGGKSRVRTFYLLLLEIKVLIVVINTNFSHKFMGWPERFKKKAGFITELRNYDEKESVAAVLRMCTEQVKTKGFGKIKQEMKGIGRIEKQLERMVSAFQFIHILYVKRGACSEQALCALQCLCERSIACV